MAFDQTRTPTALISGVVGRALPRGRVTFVFTDVVGSTQAFSHAAAMVVVDIRPQ